MVETNISFYLKTNRIHVFMDALRGIGSPKYICFLISDDGSRLIMKPYDKKDFHSHRVPVDVYNGCKRLELSSLPLCKILTEMFEWSENDTYRVPGKILIEQGLVVFYLNEAEKFYK